MKFKASKIKRIFILLLIFLLFINSFMSFASDNDGSAFITKAEFDSLKNDFQSQLDEYNRNIDNTISNAIAAYLAGVKVGALSTKNILYGGNDAEKITCIGDWGSTSNPLIQPNVCGANVHLLSHVRGDSGTATGGQLFELTYSHDTVANGKSFMGKAINVTGTGTYARVVWDGYTEDLGTTIQITGVLSDTHAVTAAYGTYTGTNWQYFCPNLSTGFYYDWNLYSDLFKIYEQYVTRWPSEQNWSADTSWYDYIDQQVLNTYTLSDKFKDVVSFDKETILIGLDDPRFVWVPAGTYYYTQRQELWTKAGTATAYRCGVQKAKGVAETLHTFSHNNNFTGYGSGTIPMFGSKLVDTRDVNVKNYNINVGKVIENDIKLVNGIPLFDAKKGDKIEWEVQMDDTDDYIFYFSATRFTDEPDPSRCIKCTTNKSSIETTEPEIVGGKTKIYLTAPSDGVVWAKWKHKNSLGNAVLNLQRCNTYQLTKA